MKTAHEKRTNQGAVAALIVCGIIGFAISAIGAVLAVSLLETGIAKGNGWISAAAGGVVLVVLVTMSALRDLAPRVAASASGPRSTPAPEAED